jgi:hypothetical protein
MEIWKVFEINPATRSSMVLIFPSLSLRNGAVSMARASFSTAACVRKRFVPGFLILFQHWVDTGNFSPVRWL